MKTCFPDTKMLPLAAVTRLRRSFTRVIAPSLLCLGSSCYLSTQRLPGPMSGVTDPLPKGSLESYPPGTEEVLVVRHADPVQLRPAGRASSYPFSYYRKQDRAKAGSWVFVGAGGRGEVIWPNGSAVIFFGRGSGIVGSPSRSEPHFIMREVTRMRVNMVEGDQVELIGGGILSAESGPILVVQKTPEILRIQNQSKGIARLAYREERIELDPGNVIDLPLIASGGAPVFDDPGFESVDGPAGPLEARGDVAIEQLHAGVRFTAQGDHEVRGQGVRIEVEPGETFTFLPLGEVEPPADTESATGSTEEASGGEPTADSNP
ncbi:MAG: hypothetical protein ACI835_000307 [Planctomycetota bacterium]|jgi:hypothetical protein